MKTLKQYEYDKKRCKYCGGTGYDLFNVDKPCPNCSSKPILIKSYDAGKNNNRTLKNPWPRLPKLGSGQLYNQTRSNNMQPK